jgi:hypothetical protein
MQKNPYGQTYKGDNHTFRMFKDEGDDLGTVPWNQKIFQNDTSHKCPTYVTQTPPCQGSIPRTMSNQPRILCPDGQEP